MGNTKDFISMPMRVAVFLLSVGWFVGFAGVPVTQANGTVVKVDPPSAVVNPSATALVNVRIENAHDLAGAEVHLVYDPNVIEVREIQAGGFPAPDFVAESKFGGGRVDYAIAQMPQQHPPVSGSGTMLTVTFVPRNNGLSDLNFGSVILADAKGKAIPMVTQRGAIKVDLITTSSRASAPAERGDQFQPIRDFFDWLLSTLGIAR